MDTETIAAALRDAVPFNGHIGIEFLQAGDGVGVARLPEARNLTNHVGSQHAAALFGVGEAASGAVVVATFAERFASVTPLARSASIRYTKIARGPITATARLAAPAAEVLAALDRDGRADFPVEIALADESGVAVAEMTVEWSFRARREG